MKAHVEGKKEAAQTKKEMKKKEKKESGSWLMLALESDHSNGCRVSFILSELMRDTVFC